MRDFPQLKSARIGAAEALFARNNTVDDGNKVALELLTNLKLKKDEYDRIRKVTPKEYEDYFMDVRG